jgi:hypothetical protein
MTNRAVITLASLVFERDDLLVLALFQNFGSHLCPGNKWASLRHVFSVGKHQYLAKGRCLARLNVEKIDIDRVAFGDAKLPATSPDNCVSHFFEFVGEKSRPKFHRWAGLATGKLSCVDSPKVASLAFKWLRRSFPGRGNDLSV